MIIKREVVHIYQIDDDVIAFVKFINVTYPLKTFKCKHFKHKLSLGYQIKAPINTTLLH